jgi:hypothetical protein
MTDPTLFDQLEQTERAEARAASDDAKRRAGLQAGIQKRDDAMTRGARKADPVWVEAARQAIRQTARDLPEFIVDHVFERMDWSHAYGSVGIKTTDQRAVGSLILEAARKRIIARTEKYLPSFNPSHHACPRRVWRSLIHGGK